MTMDSGDRYGGPARLAVGGSQFDVQVELRGCFQPIDGRYHWYGRTARHGGLAARLGAARATATLTTPEGSAPCELSDPDPWGRYRITGISTPPFAARTSLKAPAGTRERPPGERAPGERAPGDQQASSASLPRHVRIAIIGAGFSGIGAGIRLREAGVTDFVICEKADAVGGTWRDNTYPGCACDVPSHLYSFSFAPNPGWSHSFSRQPEIRRYLEDVTDRYGVRGHILFSAEVTQARWDRQHARWALRTSRGPLTADIVIAAAGPLSEPSFPPIPGLDAFPGEIFHSARWNHGYDLTGKTVAVVGTGASAVQMIPVIQPQVGRLVLFQRTPAWVMPRMDRPITAAEKWLYDRFPAVQRAARLGIYLGRESNVAGFVKWPALLKAAQRIALRNLQRSVHDPDLRAKLTPDYVMGCKRILLSSDYYPALTRPNVEVVASGLAKVDGSTLTA